ncbi:MAG: diguanylate cyclase domain-containing protein [Deltaproteobacteria bacterium]
MPARGTATHALVIEPDAARAAQYSHLLERRGLVPTVVQSGEEALFALSHLGALAIILIEAALPDGDGLSFLEEIRGSLREETAPAILIVGTRNAHEKAARAMIRLGVAALLPPSHTLGSLEKAVDRAVNRKAEPDAGIAAAPEELPPETEPPAPSVVGSHPLVRELALLPGLRSDSDEELRAAATSTARTFGAAVGMIWVETGQRPRFALHLEDAVPQRSPLREIERWTPVRSAIGGAPLFVADVMQHEVLRRTPLLPDRSSGTLLGAPLMVDGKAVGALAILQPHVVGRLGRDLMRPLSFWAQRLSGDLQLRRRSAARTAAMPAPAPRGIAESVADMLAAGLLVSDRAGIVCFANAALGRLLGVALPRCVGETRAVVLRNLGTAAGADDGVVSAVVGAHDGLPQEMEFEVQYPQRRILQWRARFIELASGTGILDELADVTVEAERARAKDALVRIDESTGLPNKEGAEDALGREVARSLRSGVPFSVALFALDGAQTGASREEAFKQVAWLLRSTARRYDYVARLDALRLVAVLAETPADHARAFARRFLSQVRGPTGLVATASAGIAQFDAGRNIQEILRDASLKLSEAKRLGGNRVA